MADLQIAPAREKNVLPALLIALLVLAAVAFAVFYFNPLGDDEELDPGRKRTATLVLPIPGRDAAAWKNKRSATLTLELRNQGAQTVRLP